MRYLQTILLKNKTNSQWLKGTEIKFNCHDMLKLLKLHNKEAQTKKSKNDLNLNDKNQ